MLNTVEAFKGDDEIVGLTDELEVVAFEVSLVVVVVWKLKFLSEEVEETLDVDFSLVKLVLEIWVDDITSFGVVEIPELLTTENLLVVVKGDWLFEVETTVLDSKVEFLTLEGVVKGT